MMNKIPQGINDEVKFCRVLVSEAKRTKTI